MPMISKAFNGNRILSREIKYYKKDKKRLKAFQNVVAF